MINVESIIYSILSGNATVAASFSTRITPMVVPFDSTMPAIAYRISGIERFETMTAASDIDKYSVQISVYSLKYSDLYTLCAAVISAMIGHANASVDRIFLVGMSDDIEQQYTTADTSTPTGQYLYIRNLDFTIFKK